MWFYADIRLLESNASKPLLFIAHSTMRQLSKSSLALRGVIAWREVCACPEACADACERVSECAASVVMKNT